VFRTARIDVGWRMAESEHRWTGWRGWAGDCAFAVAVGLCLGAVGPFGTYVSSPLGFRLVYWSALFLVGVPLYGSAIRAAVALDGRWRIPGALWLLGFCIAASAPTSLISATVATRVWPFLRAMTAWGWFTQSVSLSVPLVVTYGVLSRRLAPFAKRPPAGTVTGGPVRLQRLPERLTRGLVCLQMEDHYVRVHSRGGSELVLISMREAIASLAGRDGAQVHRSWWVTREAVAGTVSEGRNLRLRLVNGLEAPVSRSRVAELRAAGWLDQVEAAATDEAGADVSA
jgi:hypothetical protein